MLTSTRLMHDLLAAFTAEVQIVVELELPGLLHVLLLRQPQPLHDLLHVRHVSPAQAQLEPIVEVVLEHWLIVLKHSVLQPLLLPIPHPPLWLLGNFAAYKLVSIDSIPCKLP